MLSVGALIFVALRPLIQIWLCVSGGFIITKADLFPIVAAKGAGQIALNVTIPCLMFSKIVPAFDSSNIHVLGPLIAIGAIYQVLGIIIAWMVQQLFWVPHRFRHGLIVAGGWPNFGDLPTAVIMSIAGSSPFKGQSDQDLSVAYISALILFYVMTFFPLGGNILIAMDYQGPDVEPEEVQAAMRKKHQRIIRSFRKLIGRPNNGELTHSDPEKENQWPSGEHSQAIQADTTIDPPKMRRHVSFLDESSTAVPTEGPTREDSDHKKLDVPSVPNERPSLVRRTLPVLKAMGQSLCMPASLSIIVSFPIALINPLKALFVEVDGFYMHPAPDGYPPLAMFFDFAEFMGAAAVPLNLICLGSALARLNVPRSQWPTLPLGAIFSFAAGRMVIMPVLGVLICQGLIHVNFISQDDKVLQFVCIFFSCLPTGTTQVFVTQVYSRTGEAEHLSAFLIPQYILMFFSMTVLSAYALHILF